MISHHPDDPDPRLKRGVVEQLRRQNEVILNAAGEGIYGLDLQGNATFVNPAAARMVGWEVEKPAFARQPLPIRNRLG